MAPNPQDSLMALMGGGMRANDAVQLAGLRNTRKLERQNQDADPRELQILDAEMADDPFTGEAAQAEQVKQNGLRSMLFDYNRPDVASMRNEELANKERLATAPARTTGQYNVEAARVAGREHALVAQDNQNAQQARFDQEQANIDRRQATSQQNMTNRSELTGLLSGKQHAPRPQNEGFLSRWFTGPGQSDLDANRVAELRGGDGQQVADDFSDAQVGDIAEAEDGTPIVFNGQNWVAANAQ